MTSELERKMDSLLCLFKRKYPDDFCYMNTTDETTEWADCDCYECIDLNNCKLCNLNWCDEHSDMCYNCNSYICNRGTCIVYYNNTKLCKSCDIETCQRCKKEISKSKLEAKKTWLSGASYIFHCVKCKKDHERATSWVAPATSKSDA